MKTSRPVSFLSYSSKYEVLALLSSLNEDGYIDGYAFIPHFEDESISSKSHIHVVLWSDRIIDTDKLSRLSDGVLVLPRKSSLHDWGRYVIHDSAYLHSKGVFVPKFSYSIDDIEVGGGDLAVSLFYREFYSREYVSDIERIMEFVRSDIPWFLAAQYLHIRVPFLNAFHKAYLDLCDAYSADPTF